MDLLKIKALILLHKVIYLFYLFILMKFFCSNPVQQDENLIFTVQERNINIIINLIYEMNN